MRRLALLSIFTLSLLPALAFADQGVALKLSWDHCAGDGYVSDRSFACNTNTGSEALWLSMVITDGAERGNVQGFSALVDFRLTSVSIPAWWQLATNQCRAGAMTANFTAPAASGSCEPWFRAGGGEPLGVSLIQYAVEGPDMLRFNLAAAVPAGSEATLAPATEYLLARIQISHSKSTGTSACTGCLVPTCVGFGELELLYPGSAPAQKFVGSMASTATWQGGYVSSFTPTLPYVDEYGVVHYTYSANLHCSTGPVPARNHTWGAIKSMYH